MTCWPVLVTATCHSPFILPLYICLHYWEKWILDEEEREKGWQIGHIAEASWWMLRGVLCQTCHVMICNSSQYATRPGGEIKGDSRDSVIFFTVSLCPSPWWWIHLVQHLTKCGPDHMNNKNKRIDLCNTNKCSIKENSHLRQVTSCESIG